MSQCIDGWRWGIEEHAIPLDELQEGSFGEVMTINGDADFKLKMGALGIKVGKHLFRTTAKDKSSLNLQVIILDDIKTDKRQISLEEAKKIYVEILEREVEVCNSGSIKPVY